MEKCFKCNCEITGDVYYDTTMPFRPLCQNCYEDDYCKCGSKVFENGMCIDCSAEHELKQEDEDED